MTTTSTNYDYSQLNPASSSTSSSAKNDNTNVMTLATNFLKLLTTQLQNQDPLNPVDNAQLTSQLAQLNMVQGINTLNSTMQTMLNNTNQNQILQAGLLVGHSVLVKGSSTVLKAANGGAAFGVELAGKADSVSAVIKDKDGNTVRTLSLGKMDAGVQSLAWDGNKDDGTAAADGTYSVTFTATQAGKSVTATSLQIATVIGALNGSSGIQLDLGALGKVAVTDVKQII